MYRTLCNITRMLTKYKCYLRYNNIIITIYMLFVSATVQTSWQRHSERIWRGEEITM